MKTYTVRITRQAREHLRNIKLYITNELLAPEAAKSTLATLKKEITKYRLRLSYMFPAISLSS